jgi:hypothetical protein
MLDFESKSPPQSQCCWPYSALPSSRRPSLDTAHKLKMEKSKSWLLIFQQVSANQIHGPTTIFASALSPVLMNCLDVWMSALLCPWFWFWVWQSFYRVVMCSLCPTLISNISTWLLPLPLCCFPRDSSPSVKPSQSVCVCERESVSVCACVRECASVWLWACVVEESSALPRQQLL